MQRSVKGGEIQGGVRECGCWCRSHLDAVAQRPSLGVCQEVTRKTDVLSRRQHEQAAVHPSTNKDRRQGGWGFWVALRDAVVL